MKQLELIPTICQSGNYVVLSLGATPAFNACKQAATIPEGMISAPSQWTSLTGQSADSVSVPKTNLVFFLSQEFAWELAKWKNLDFWDDIDPGMRKVLTDLVNSKKDGSLLATVNVRPDGVLFRGLVNGRFVDSKSFQAVKVATRIIAAELVPQLAKLAHQQWSKLELPAKPEPKPTPKPETPEDTEADGN